MSINSLWISAALGAGIGRAVIFFPITYFLTRKRLNLREPLSDAWRSFVAVSLIFAVFAYFRLLESTVTYTELALFFIVPTVICALVLNFTFKKTE